TRRPAETATTLRDAISGFITARAGYFFEHPDFFRIYVLAIARQSTNAQTSACHAMVQQQTRRLEQAVVRAITRREIRRVDPTATALAIFDLTRGLVARRMMAQADADVTHDAVFLADLIWRGLAAAAKPGQRRGVRPGRHAAGGAQPAVGPAPPSKRAGIRARPRAEIHHHHGETHKAVRKR
ncbi:MAG: hypothetical protein ABJC89_14660, partial [Acidobacteriota bacterium]